MLPAPRRRSLRTSTPIGRAANRLFVGQIYLKTKPLPAVPLNASMSSRDCWDIGDDAGCQLPLQAAQPDHQRLRS